MTGTTAPIYNGIDWTIHLWLGSVFMAGITGLFLGFLTVRSLSTSEEHV